MKTIPPACCGEETPCRSFFVPLPALRSCPALAAANSFSSDSSSLLASGPAPRRFGMQGLRYLCQDGIEKMKRETLMSRSWVKRGRTALPIEQVRNS